MMLEDVEQLNMNYLPSHPDSIANMIAYDRKKMLSETITNVETNVLQQLESMMEDYLKNKQFDELTECAETYRKYEYLIQSLKDELATLSAKPE